MLRLRKPVPIFLLIVVSGLAPRSESIAQRANPFSSAQPGYPTWSPFSAIRWKGDTPVVRIENAWYELVSVHGVATVDVLKFCEEKEWDAKERFAEDLVQILRLMGHKIDKKTDLVLTNADGQRVTMNNIMMTEESRRQVSDGGRAAEARVTVPRTGNPFLSSVPGYPSWSAFTGVRWEGEQPIVQVNDEWYELVSFHDIPTEEIIQFIKQNGWPLRRRFTEDLVQIVRLMGHDIDKRADLGLRDDAGNVVTKRKAEMTAANLRRIVGVPGIITPADNLNQADVVADLEHFQRMLESQFSYLKANDAEYEAAIAAIAEKAEGGMDGSQFAEELQKVIALFIDGHAGVSGATSGFVDGYLPFLIEPSEDRFVAVLRDRSGLVDPELPYVVAIDGVELQRWLEATEQYVPQGSPQYKRDRGLRLLRSIQHFRGILGLETPETIDVTLVSRDGKTRRRRQLDVSAQPAIYGTWPLVQPPETLEGNIGYMRLAQMNAEAVRLIRDSMPRFRNTQGLIVDVRGNGGGIRTPILELAGYLLTKDDPPRIGNVAKYRLAAHFSRDHLSAARYVYREDSDQLDERERDAIRRFKETFSPQWEPPLEQFSQWHYLVLSKRPENTRFDYSQPVVILLDEHCFSATDIFIGAFKGWPFVTLIGQPSGGGSARSESFQLPRSGITIRCASMASFQKSGLLYDGNGVQPDIEVSRPPEYYIEGGPDAILEKAVDVLKNMQSGNNQRR